MTRVPLVRKRREKFDSSCPGRTAHYYYHERFFHSIVVVSAEHRSVRFVYTVATLDPARSEETDQSQSVLPDRLHRRHAFRHRNPDNRQSGGNG